MPYAFQHYDVGYFFHNLALLRYGYTGHTMSCLAVIAFVNYDVGIVGAEQKNKEFIEGIVDVR